MTSLATEILFYDQQQLVFTKTLAGPLELGRQNEANEPLFVESKAGRLALARLEEQTIPRRFLRISPRSAGRLRVENLTTNRPLRLDDGSEVPPATTRDVPLPVVIALSASKAIRVKASEESRNEPRLRSLPQATMAPGISSMLELKLESPLRSLRGENDDVGRSMIRWLQASMGVFQSAATSSDFFSKAAQAVVEIAGLETGRVLLWKGGQWESQACYVPPPGNISPEWVPSRRVLNRVRDEKRTLWELPEDLEQGGASLQDVAAIVAAPILNRNQEVIGAVYGDRRQNSRGALVPTVTELEAMLVELVSCAIAAGLARLEQEEAALRAHVQFEQFFTPELARQLALQPDLLEGRDCEVTVLFCDIRGFSRFSECLGPAKTVQWIRDVMGALSDCVLAHHGVLVDYIGDELMAMWGAPEEEPNHASLACKAALDMLQCLPALNAEWSATLGGAMDLGIGINSGPARVGNTGSRHKFKYGPLGNTVNLSSRVQGATKYLRARLLITGSTHVRLAEASELVRAARRLCAVRVVNIAEPVVLYELAAANQSGWLELKRAYEMAFDEFQRGNFRGAAQIAANILATHPDDGPTIVLLSRAGQCLANAENEFDPVWELPGK
jgi:adenylate cyclase